MKKLIIFYITIASLSASGCAELDALLPSTTKTGGLTTEEIARGLKEALSIGANNSIMSASALNGFYGNPQIFIPFPPEAVKVKNTLEKAGFNNLIQDFEKSINSAAEEASGKALPIFRNAITGITITDAMGILHGSDNAATMYLKSKTEEELKAEFLPIVKVSIQSAKVTAHWNPIATTYNKLAVLTGGAQVNPNLENYITQKSLDGLFFLISQEEEKIRKNPAARVTELLQKVFAMQ